MPCTAAEPALDVNVSAAFAHASATCSIVSSIFFTCFDAPVTLHKNKTTSARRKSITPKKPSKFSKNHQVSGGSHIMATATGSKIHATHFIPLIQRKIALNGVTTKSNHLSMSRVIPIFFIWFWRIKNDWCRYDTEISYINSSHTYISSPSPILHSVRTSFLSGRRYIPVSLSGNTLVSRV